MGRGESKLKRRERYLRGKEKKVDEGTLNPGDNVIAAAGPKKRPILVENDGKYQLKIAIPESAKKIDTQSSEYKRALREYNVRAAFNSDGSVQVKNGGLYSRSKKFKDINAFEKDVNEKIDSLTNYYNKVVNNRQKGYVPQVQVDSIKNIVRSNPSGQAIGKIQKMISSEIMSYRTQAAAGEDMKRRLKFLIDEHRK